jgi:heme-degrading monooxygenase HmoA
MIARTWYGAVPLSKAHDYLQLLRSVGLRDYVNVAGNRGAFALERIDGTITNFGLLSFWDSLQAIERYASGDINVPQYTSFDPHYLMSLEPTIQHHCVYANRFGVGEDAKVARMWHGTVPLDKAEAYQNLMRTIALDEYERVTGNEGAFVLQRRAPDVAHFTMLTFWESLDAIGRFAGQPIDRAKYYDFDPEYLLEMEPAVLHYDVHGLLASDEQLPHGKTLDTREQ